MPRLSQLLTIVALATLATPATLSAQGACEAMAQGPARTDCFIGRARIANQRSNLASDKARTAGDAAKLRAATLRKVDYRQPCRGKRAGTRACYRCCRAHRLSASRCLRSCRQP
jgi:hypothetical protein